MPIITLTTDFGLADGYVAAMKGVIAGIAPHAVVVDITHQIPPQDVCAAAYVLHTTLPSFPPGAVHVAVVDPGVGSARRALAVRTARGLLVGPDNGVFTYVLQAEPFALCIELDQPAYWRPTLSRTFHGRDLFAPVAAHLAAGAALEQLGTPVADPVLLEIAAPERFADGRIHGSIVYIDHFGNLISNIPSEWLTGRRWLIYIADRQLTGPLTTYSEAAPGALLALPGSNGLLEIALREGNAAQQLAGSVGMAVMLHPQTP